MSYVVDLNRNTTIYCDGFVDFLRQLWWHRGHIAKWSITWSNGYC